MTIIDREAPRVRTEHPCAVVVSLKSLQRVAMPVIQCSGLDAVRTYFPRACILRSDCAVCFLRWTSTFAPTGFHFRAVSESSSGMLR